MVSWIQFRISDNVISIYFKGDVNTEGSILNNTLKDVGKKLSRGINNS